MDWRGEEAKQRINTSYSLIRWNEGKDRKMPWRTRESERRRRAREKETNEIAARDSVSQGKPRLYRGPGLFEARRRSSNQPTVCTVKVARIDRTAGLSSTSIDNDYFRHRILGVALARIFKNLDLVTTYDFFIRNDCRKKRKKKKNSWSEMLILQLK